MYEQSKYFYEANLPAASIWEDDRNGMCQKLLMTPELATLCTTCWIGCSTRHEILETQYNVISVFPECNLCLQPSDVQLHIHHATVLSACRFGKIEGWIYCWGVLRLLYVKAHMMSSLEILQMYSQSNDILYQYICMWSHMHSCEEAWCESSAQ